MKGWGLPMTARFDCSPKTPWGIHAAVRNDEDCPRCGWTAPGPRGDARAAAAELGWSVIEGGGPDGKSAPESRAA